MRVRVRYDMPDEKGETRRARNERFGTESPEFYLPDTGKYIWEWYWNLSQSLRRVRDGVCEPIPPSEFLAWREATGNIVYPWEYAILCEIDAAFCDETNKELKDYRERQAEELKNEAKKH